MVERRLNAHEVSQALLAFSEKIIYDKIPSRHRHQLEEPIKPLVGALLGLGVITYSSCQGHLDETKHEHPWVSWSWANGVDQLQSLVEEFNEQSEIKWQAKGWLIPIAHSDSFRCCGKKGENQSSDGITPEILEELRVSALALAEFLFTHVPPSTQNQYLEPPGST